jgi:hypothetical protein
MTPLLETHVFGVAQPEDGGPSDAPPKPASLTDSQRDGWRGNAHPDAPDGGGGPGGFGFGILGRDGGLDDQTVNPRAPAARYAAPDAGTGSAALPLNPDAGAPPMNPPPLETRDRDLPPKTFKDADATFDVELRGRVLKDDAKDRKDDKADAGSAPKKFATTGISAPAGQISLELWMWTVESDDKTTVTDVSRTAKDKGKRRPAVVITFEVQTIYYNGTDPSGLSAYGRGTQKDKDDGNGTLGFHESCHRNDLANYAQYFDTAKFPKFKGKAGMSLDQFKAEKEKFFNEVLQFAQDLTTKARAASRQNTDEVNYKKSDYLRDHPGAPDPESE